jgi:dienelactone hydrolase
MIRAAILPAFGILVAASWSFAADGPTTEQRDAWQRDANALLQQIRGLRSTLNDDRKMADAEICAKAVLWIAKHNEFFRPDYARWTDETLALGHQRLQALSKGKPDWLDKPGVGVSLGYYSELDGSVQPYAVTLPADFDRAAKKRWPLHVVLHGRNANLTEVSFIHDHQGKAPKEPISWIQLDIFGRTNNAYRWAGEVDVFEALAATKRLYPIDDKRITLWGFSMGGAGAWHLGLHHPDQWSSVGAGAGFADTVKYLNLKEPLSPIGTKLVRIYDPVEYALNAFNVPTVGYGGELDKQLAAAKLMSARAAELGTSIKLLVGPQTEHKFHPDSWKEFLAFHLEASQRGRPMFPGLREIRFTTCTVKYNSCEWITIEEQSQPYEPSTVSAKIDGDVVRVETKNIELLQLARDVGDVVVIDGGKKLPLNAAADGLLPGVYYEHRDDGWEPLNYRESHEYLTQPEGRKRHNLQGPIDDAFTRPFVCVKPTGKPWSQAHADWAQWNLERFRREYDKYLRADLPVINDNQVTEELIETKHLILFGDPGSNSVLARVVDKLPLQWDKTSASIAGKKVSPDSQAVVMVYPNPLNPGRYVVLNSGHTFHEAEFKASNANLFPKLGDVGIAQFERANDGQFSETVTWSEIFSSAWDWP